eukprot:TRINITY_DN9857_c0_g1_i1.p1 TRINITY_DN9857_c0_g1~~TRINITY_DN9857_c0_g1_i1.p1  ORF type:complete len:378 (-),score=55.75 TRINITY_DN9857_c0_g1_i1:120-1253(-)
MDVGRLPFGSLGAETRVHSVDYPPTRCPYGCHVVHALPIVAKSQQASSLLVCRIPLASRSDNGQSCESRYWIRTDSWISSRREWRTTRVQATVGPSPPAEDKDAKEDLADKLRAAEAEADALRKELAARKAQNVGGDLSKGKPAAPVKRIDGTGFRETMFGPGMGVTVDQGMAKWGLSESDLITAERESNAAEGRPEGEKSDAQGVVNRRLAIGAVGTVVTIALSLIKLPAQLGGPTKPLFFYLVPLVKLRGTLEALGNEDEASDVVVVAGRLQSAVGSAAALKENLLSAATLYGGAETDKATTLAFEIIEYIDQADYRRYFENRGEPSASQRTEFLTFSLQSIKAALSKLNQFLAFAPTDALEAAQLQAGATVAAF